MTNSHDPAGAYRFFNPDQYAYKDRPPSETVRIIKRILESNEVPIDVDHISHHGLVHSFAVLVSGTPLLQQGKGVTEDFALASAYGEMMERLLNGIRFNRIEFDAGTISELGYYWDPHEELFGPEALPSLPEAFRRGVFEPGDVSVYDLWQSYRAAKPGPERSRVFTPWFCPTDGRTHLLPIHFIQTIYGSNGMSAGNSPGEALGQAICEIFERHAMKRIFFGKITPPTIRRADLEKHAPFQYEMIRALEGSGDYRIIVKDCSVGEGLPVIATILLMPRLDRYTVRFGSSAFWPIALERCLTEAFQGVPARQMPASVPINRETTLEGGRRHEHWGRMLKYSAGGQFPAEIFHDAPDADVRFGWFMEPGPHSQQEVFSFLWGLLKAKGLPGFIRDVSCPEISAYQVVVPSLSEVKRMDLGEWSAANNCGSRVEMLAELPGMGEAGVRGVVRSIERRMAWEGWDGRLTVADWAGVPVDGDAPWARVELGYFLGLLHWRLRSWAEAHRALAGLMVEWKKRGVKPGGLESAMNDAAALAKSGVAIRQIESMLEMSYGSEMAGTIRTALADPEGVVFSAAPGMFLPPGFFGPRDGVYQDRTYQNTARVYRTIKRFARDNPPDPGRLAALFGSGGGGAGV